jgi:hypothetical protein
MMTTKTGKPKLFRRERNDWGVLCSVRNYATISQLRAAWDSYADSLSPERTICQVFVKFDDDSFMRVACERVSKSVEWKDYDGEIWSSEYLGKQWYCTDGSFEEGASNSPIKAVKNCYFKGGDKDFTGDKVIEIRLLTEEEELWD